MNPQRDTLSEALRELAAASPQASPELGARLNSEFTRHHARRRRRNRVAFAIGLAACLAISVVLFRSGKQTKPVKVLSHHRKPRRLLRLLAANAATESPEVPAPSVTKVATRPRVHSNQSGKPRRRDNEAPPVTVEAGDFVALPTFDPAIPLGVSRMVRVDMPGSALQLIGYPIDGQLLDRRSRLTYWWDRTACHTPSDWYKPATFIKEYGE